MGNIILIGFMGCGKTSVGIRLSGRLCRTMTDTDKLIERIQEKSVSEIFEELGEEEFRKLETLCLKQLLTEKGERIISVGGGLPLRSENRELLKQLGTVVYLRVTAQTVCERLKNDTTRPLLSGANPEEKIHQLLEMRAPVYESAADVIIDADNKDYDMIIDEIMERVIKG